MSATQTQSVGTLLRDWRQRRRFSQLDLACEAEISSRHLSFLETGRSVPSREMILHLAEALKVPLRERNILLMAAGYAPAFRERNLNDSGLDAARKAVELVLASHEPYPAIAVDRHWTLLFANKALAPLLVGTDPELLKPPVNVLRLAVHPRGVAPRIVNLREWKRHLLARLRQQIDNTADPALMELLQELSSYQPSESESVARDAKGNPFREQNYGGVVVPLQIATPVGTLSLFSTVTIFGTPVDVTLSELAVESFFPADAESGEKLRLLAETNP
jgi:transcriptional regulator with XRE-family HTH domain